MALALVALGSRITRLDVLEKFNLYIWWIFGNKQLNYFHHQMRYFLHLHLARPGPAIEERDGTRRAIQDRILFLCQIANQIESIIWLNHEKCLPFQVSQPTSQPVSNKWAAKRNAPSARLEFEREKRGNLYVFASLSSPSPSPSSSSFVRSPLHHFNSTLGFFLSVRWGCC